MGAFGWSFSSKCAIEAEQKHHAGEKSNGDFRCISHGFNFFIQDLRDVGVNSQHLYISHEMP